MNQVYIINQFLNIFSAGGPKLDIIGRRDDSCGYLADKQEEYADFVVRAITKFNDTFHRKLRENARQWIQD